MTACLAADVRSTEGFGDCISSLFDPRGRIPGRSWIAKVIACLDYRLRMLTQRKRS